MDRYFVVIGSFANGIENLIGPFESEWDAEYWIEKTELSQGQSARVLKANAPQED